MRSFGTAYFNAKRKLWQITCEPHVRMKLKRIFPKISLTTKEVSLAESLDTTKDLSWFLERYPMELDEASRLYLTQRSEEYDTIQENVSKILEGQWDSPAKPLAYPLRPYQEIAVNLALLRQRLIIADDLGLGKTVEAIGIFAQGLMPALVVTLTALTTQWQRTIEEFLPGTKVHVLKKGTPYPLDQPDVIVTNYAKLSGWALELHGKVKCLIFDECHELRRTGTDKYKSAKLLADHATHVVGFSGTPIYNAGEEFFNIADVIVPNQLGTRTEYLREWCNHRGHVISERAFGMHLREIGLLIRRTRDEVGRELPPFNIIPYHIDADSKPLDDVKTIAQELAQRVLTQTGFSKMQASEDLNWQLRMATGIAKANQVAGFVSMIAEQEPVVVYTWHHAVNDILVEKLKAYNPVLFTGEQSPAQKQKSLDAFISGASKVLIMNVRAGQGIDGLQKVCKTCVFAEIDWVYAIHEQAIGRIGRDGQQHSINVYFMLSDSGSDPIISGVLGLKKAQLKGIRDPFLEDVPEQVDYSKIETLAKGYLNQVGITLPEVSPSSA